jgi:type III pantothenate kinase
VAESSLLIDMGNTRIKWVRAVHGRIEEESHGSGELEDFRKFVNSRTGEQPDRVLLSSVAAEDRSAAVMDVCTSHWGVAVSRLHTSREQAGIINAYDRPETLGVDRWLAIVGAAHTYGMPVVIWDLGTAATLDAVNKDGQHQGGLIFPGPATMLNSLKSETMLSVPGGLDDTKENAIHAGKTTSQCIVQGVRAAQLGALHQFLESTSEGARQTQTQRLQLIVTGGAAEGILSGLDMEYVFDPWLVFRGMLTC